MAVREGKIPNTAPSDSGPFYKPGDLRLLVIDDDPSIGRLIKAAFAPQGFNVDVVLEPAQVEARLNGEPYQVILLDYVLPGLDSSEVMRWVRDYQPDASVIVVTGFPTMDSALHCLRAHTYDYITKPFEIDYLKKVVLGCLEGRGLLRLSEEALREQLGAAIRERRKTLGLTLAEMAKRSNVSLGYLSQIELGKNSASVETLYRIALGLRMRVADLFQSIQSQI